MPFKMVIEDVFSVAGRGTVLTGTIQSGSVSRGQELQLTSPTRSIRITFTLRGIDKFRRTVDVAGTGDQVGLLVPIARDQVLRGDILERVDEHRDSPTPTPAPAPDPTPTGDDQRLPGAELSALRLNGDTQDAPLLLLPARLETRFDGNRLRMRVFPDALHASPPPRPLSPADIAAGHAFLKERRRAGDAFARELLASLLGPGRAQFVARRALDNSLREETLFVNRIHAANLPQHFIFHAIERHSGASFSVLGQDVDQLLPLVPGHDDSGFALLRTDPLFWMRDFDNAVAKGMAAEISLPAGLADAPESRFDVSAFGVTAGDGTIGAAQLTGLLARLSETSGLVQLDPGTPTKGRESGKTGAFASLARSNVGADRIAQALGLDATLPETAAHSADIAPLSQALFKILWEACLRPVVIDTLGFESQTFGLLEGDIDLVARELAAELQPFGLPHLRAGNHLFGVLPVHWEEEQATAGLVAGVSEFARSLASPLAAVASQTRAANKAKAPPESLAETLFRAPQGQGWRRRARWFAPDLASALLRLASPAGQASPTVDAVRRALQQAQEKLRDAGLDALLTEAGAPLSEFIGSPFADLLCGPLVAKDALLRPEGSLEDPHIQRLLENGEPLRVPGGRASDEDPGVAHDPLPILSSLAEDAVLVVLSDIAAMVASEGSTALAARLLRDDETDTAHVQSPRQKLASQLLESRIDFDAVLGDPDVQSFAADRAKHLEQLLDALQFIQSTPPAAVHAMLAALIDCFSTRFDAWTDLDVRRRVSDQRAADRGRAGIQLGTWAFVENLRSSPITRLASYIAAPSTRLAHLAGLLLRANEAISALGMGDAAMKGLDAERVRAARSLLNPLAAGESLEDVLAHLIVTRLPQSQRIEIAGRLAQSFPRAEDEEGKSARLRFSPLTLLEAGAASVSGLDNDGNNALAAALENAGKSLEALADIALAEGALNLSEGRPEAAQAALAQRSAGAVPQAEPQSINHMATASSLGFAVVLTGGDVSDGGDIRASLNPPLADVAQRLIGKLSGKIRLVSTTGGAPPENPERELMSMGMSPLGLAWLAAPDSPTEMMIGTIAAFRDGAADSWMAEPDEEARETLWAASRAYATLSAARSIEPEDFADDEEFGGAVPALDEVMLERRITRSREQLTDLRMRAVELVDELASATIAEEITHSANGLVADMLTCGIITAAPGMAARDLLGRAAASLDQTLAEANAASSAAEKLQILLGDMPACLPLHLPVAPLWAPRQIPLSGASRPELFEWLEVSQRVRSRLEPVSDLLLARPLDLSCHTVQWPNPADGDQVDWIGGPRKHGDAYASRNCLVAFGSWQLGDKVIEGLLLDKWQEVVPAHRQTAALAVRTGSPPGRAPQVLLFAPAPAIGAWTAENVHQVIRQAIDNAQMRTLDLVDYPRGTVAGERAGDLGAILPALATISPGSALGRSLCAVMPEHDR